MIKDRNTNLKLNGQYLGCHIENGTSRDIGSYLYYSASMNVELCINACHSKNFLYAGLQNG
jgi:hypothetical protein